ncbi:MAG TPA: WD40 repeat domain-containing protein, partial [Isosphaeraceae bacterium]|nr:WD40 repeat domain-containing protein [Isosphaeraceae bacterium]
DKLTAVVSPADGRLIATASMDSTVRVWSTPERSLLRVLTGQAVGVTALALTRNDRWLISGGGRGAVLVYDRDRDFAPKLVAPRQPHNHRITQVVLLPDGVHFVSVDRDGQSMLWDPRESPLAPRAWLAGTTCQEVVCGGKLDPDGADTGIVVARCGDGKVRAFDSAGGGGAVLEFPQGRPTTLAAAPDGRLLAAGFDDGVVVVRDLKAQRQTEYQAANQPVAVRRLVISPAGRLAVGHERGARLLTLTPRPVAPDAKGGAGPGCFDLIDQPVQSLAFSPSGDFLAACTENVGALRVWRIGLEGPPTAILDDSAARACLVGFTGTGRGLLCGDFDGAVSLRPLDPQGDEAPWTFPANRGKLQQLSASPSRRFLLFLDEQRRARIWDLKERTCRRLQGTWSAGVLLDDDHLVLIPDSNAAEHAGRPVRFDRDKLQSEPAFFARTAGTFQLPDNLALERLVLSPDGSRIAAASDAAKEPFVCVWKTSTGQLTHWITPARLEDAVVALSFSSDGRYLLTGGDAPVAQLWDLSATEGEPGAPAATFADKSVRANITCAAIRPGHAEEVVTGHSDGQVHVWKWAEGKTSLEVSGLVAREFAGRVKALCFTADGQQLAAAGDGTRIWVGALDPQPRPIDVLERLRPHHLEQINALIAWPGKPVLISGSADTTVRFWDLQGGNLWGTFSAASRPDVADAAAVQELDWVFHTPDGLFDASPAAGKLVHYRRKDRPQQLDQFDETHKTFRLSEQLLEGKNPRLTQQPDDPPAVSITAPPRSDPTLPEVRLTITLGASDLKDVRLYHNDVVIPTGWGAGPQRQPGKLSHDVTVRLIPNRNRFQVMASREGAYDSSSNVVEVDYTGPMEAGQIHVLALGVGAYDRRRLQYARRDAEQLSAVLHRRGLDAQGRRGLLRVLPDTDVNRENVEEAFGEIARYVEDRPQDTVVVFLAGHTGVFDPQRFCLLLPTYPFPAEAPILVAARDVAPDSGEMAQVDPQFVLPYSVIALNLARLKALNRLVIVDACQAEAILADPRVRAIQKWMEISSRRARTSYLMAARRGEPALEVDPLGHGLFTYALLRGLGAIPGRREPKEVAALGLPRDADFNKDGIIATAELDAYSKQVLPRLASVFPQLVASRRDALVARKAPAPPDATAPLDQAAKLQGAETSFPLVPLNEVQGP